MNIEPDSRSNYSAPALETNRRRFFRQVISDAQLELSRLESVFKIMETTLLTAMGSLGIEKGFISKLKADDEGAIIVNRGVDSGTIAFFENNMQNLLNHYFPEWNSSPQNLHVAARLISTDPRQGDPLNGSQLSLLVGWRSGKALTGVIGLSEKITTPVFHDIEIDFLYSLADHMMMAIQGIATKSVIHTMENELEQARQRISDSTASTMVAQKDLEETLFRLSGFDDIFHELSDIKESAQVVDSFLLVLLGIFSASSGLILYWEETTGTVYATARGSSRNAMDTANSEEVKKILGDLFRMHQGPKIGAMQAEIVPSEHLNRFGPAISKSHITLLFRIDQATQGVLCLGKRLVQTQYGQREQELLLAFSHNFLVFLKNCRSFETIQRLHTEQELQNKELRNTIEELTTCRTTIDGMEKAGERIRSAISKAMARTQRVSVMDVAIIVIAGTLLGLLYNFASPSGIAVIPEIWQHPPSNQIQVDDAQVMVSSQKAVLVDARPVEFFKQHHIEGALNLPPALFEFVYMMRFNNLDTNQPIIVYGRTISRHYDETIAYKLTERGHRQVYVLTGGLKAWSR